MSDAKKLRFFYIFLLVWAILLVGIPSIFYTVLPLDTTEAIMWCNPPELGNAKHPPLSGWLAGLFDLIFGHSDFGMYFLSQVMVITGFVYLYRLCREYFSVAKSIIAVLLQTYVLFYCADSPKFNANLPHLMLWPMMSFYFVRSLRTDKMCCWILLGITGGLSVLSKFFGGVPLFAMFLYVLCTKKYWNLFRRPGPYTAFLFFVMVLTPYLIWLVHYDFLPFTYIADRVTEEAEPMAWYYPLFVLAGGLYPVLPPLGVLLIMQDKLFRTIFGFFRNREWGKLRPSAPEEFRLALFLFLTPLLILVFLSFCGADIDLMWTFPIYVINGFLLMALWKEDASDSEFKRIFFVTLVFFVVLQAVDIYRALYQTRTRGHFNVREMAEYSDRFYREKTGEEQIRFVYGDLWHAGNLGHYLPYHPLAGSFDDHYDMIRFKEQFERYPVLGIVSREEDKKHLEALTEQKLEWIRETFVFHAPYGKDKAMWLFFTIIPPAGEASAEKEKTTSSAL